MAHTTAYASMSDTELLRKLSDMSRYNQRAAFVLAQLTDDDVYMAVTELRRRCARAEQGLVAQETALLADGRVRSPHTVEIDAARWKTFWFSKGLRITEVGPLVGLVPNWASTIACKRKASALTLERIACELNVEADDLIWAVASDAHRERLLQVR